tara:strand:+ start:2032 stop:2538 length:507 start_codon:yes stop_codon:yes gene_type:complete
MAFDWKSTLATVAPGLATALGGPLAGMAVKMATDALGIEPNESALEAVLSSGDPEVLAKLKKVEGDFKVRMRELDIEEDRIAGKDRASARELFKVDKVPQIVLSFIFVSGYFTTLGMMMAGVWVITGEMRDVIILLLGLMTREIPTIMQFWFGSSSGSKDKGKLPVLK